MTIHRSPPKEWAETYIAEKTRIRAEYNSAAAPLARGLLRELTELIPHPTADEVADLLNAVIDPTPGHYRMPTLPPAQVAKAKDILGFYKREFGVEFCGEVSAEIPMDISRLARVDAVRIRLPWIRLQDVFEKHLGTSRPISIVADFVAHDKRLLHSYVDGIGPYDLRDMRVVKRAFDAIWESARAFLLLRNGLDG
jgi:hypothetical protein